MFGSLFDSTRNRIIGGLVAVAVLGGGGVLAATSGGDEPEPTTTTAPATTTHGRAPTTTTVPPRIAPLTGLTGVAEATASTRPAVVRQDRQRAPGPRPQSGLVQADIVIEERVEGNTTRFAAVFHSTDAVEIGPVRSTRSTDMGLIPLFGRVLYASSGRQRHRPQPAPPGQRGRHRAQRQRRGVPAESASRPRSAQPVHQLGRAVRQVPGAAEAAQAGVPVPRRRRGAPRDGDAGQRGGLELRRRGDLPVRVGSAVQAVAPLPRRRCGTSTPPACRSLPVNVVVLALAVRVLEHHGQLPAARRHHR